MQKGSDIPENIFAYYSSKNTFLHLQPKILQHGDFEKYVMLPFCTRWQIYGHNFECLSLVQPLITLMYITHTWKPKLLSAIITL